MKEGKGYIKEYDYNNKLIFEGEYLNGKKNGKGKKYYWNGQLEYEGEFLDEEKNGKGKEYDFLTGRLIYDDLFLFGKKFG